MYVYSNSVRSAVQMESGITKCIMYMSLKRNGGRLSYFKDRDGNCYSGVADRYVAISAVRRFRAGVVHPTAAHGWNCPVTGCPAIVVNVNNAFLCNLARQDSSQWPSRRLVADLDGCERPRGRACG